MKNILKLLLLDVLKFFIAYAIFSMVISKITEHLPRSWDPTGMGMLAMIVLFFGFVIGAFKVGASYSDKLEVQDPGTILGVLKRPVRSVKYGLISLLLNFGLVYILLVVNDYFFH